MEFHKIIEFVNKIILENAFSCDIIILKIIINIYIKEEKLWENLHFLGTAS